MKIINFVNNSSPDLDAQTLNQLQTNIEEAIDELDYDLTNDFEEQDIITLKNSANSTFKDIDIKGNSFQDGTPTPANPVNVQVVGEDGSTELKIQNKNLLNARLGVTIGGNDAYSISVEPNTTYSFSLTQKCVELNSSSSQHWINYYDKNSNRIRGNNILPFNFATVNEIKAGNVTITTPDNCTRISLDLGSYSSNPSKLQTIEAQLEKGNKTDFVLHEEQNKLMDIQEPMIEGDYFDWENEEEVHNYKKYIVTGNESNWRDVSSGSGWNNYANLFAFDISDGLKTLDTTKILCNQYEYNSNVFKNESLQYGIDQSNHYSRNIWILDKDYNNLANFKQHLADLYANGTPLVIYYKLATERRLPFTETQKQQATELKESRTYEEVTHISSSDEVAVIEGQYFTNNKYNNGYAKQSDIENLKKEIKLLKESLENTSE